MDNLEISTSEEIYNNIGEEYNSTRKPDPFITGRLLDLLSPQTHETYLDIGCGTGNYTVEFAEEGCRFYGIDPSNKMLEQAKSRSDKIRWMIGSSTMIPAADEFFAGAVATLTIHHWNDIERSFIELSRVLKASSRLIVFTSAPEQMKSYWLNYYFPKMLEASIQRMPSLNILEEASRKAGFNLVKAEKYFIPENIQDQFLYSGKHNPEIYFNASVRKGMSSFAALANQQEIAAGLEQLRTDLDNWAFEKVKQQYGNESGDYLFLVFKKA